MEKLPLSVSIICYNEEENIGRTLQSISDICSEIIIMDTYSTDNTIEIAKSFGAKIYQDKWYGHIKQKNLALSKCTQPWILALDADEVPTSELKLSIITAIRENKYDGFYINRKTYYQNKLLKYAWQPDKKLRLVRADKNPRWTGIDPHDELVIDGATSFLKGDLIHYSYKNLRHHMQKTIDYAQISAKTYFERGKKSSLIKLFFNPFFAFVKIYFLRLGFLDGVVGFIAGISSFIGTFLKYAFLWELEKSNKKN